MTRPEGFVNASGGQGQHTLARLFGAYSNLGMWHWTAQKGLSNAEAEAAVQDPRFLEYATRVSAQYKPEVAGLIGEFALDFIVGNLDIDSASAWSEYLSELEKVGLPILIEDITVYHK